MCRIRWDDNLQENEAEGVDVGPRDIPELLRVWGLWFMVQGSGFRVQGSGFRVQDSGFRVQGSGFRVR